jgi:hypothetical protein
MKKVLLIFSIGLFHLFCFGQQKSITSATKKVITPKLNKSSHHKFRAGSNRTLSGWLNYGLQLDDAGGPTPGLAAAQFGLVFPDTTIIAGLYSDGTVAYPEYNKYATMLDPKNMPTQGILANSSYMMDSIAIGYAYLRNLDSTVVDTLIVTIIKQDLTLNTYLDPGYENYQDIAYDSTTNTVEQSIILGTYKYYLTQNDSTSSANELYIATTGIPIQTNGAHIGAVVSFKPGYSYTINDSINSKNAFYQYSYEQNGENTDPTYYGGVADDFAGDMNCSYVLGKNVRYNIDENGWNGYFFPTWTWETSFGYENHIIEFKLNEILSVNEISENGIKIKQNIPNPFTNNSTINYELDHNSPILLTVYDITGKKIMVQNEGFQSAGQHAISVKADALSAGVYYYSLTVGTTNTTAMKMVVIK